MRGWKRVLVGILVVTMLLVSGCVPAGFKQITFSSEYQPVNMPTQVPAWWRANLSQYLRLSYIGGPEQSAFGALTGNVLFPDLYSTYASVGIERGMAYSTSLQVEHLDSVAKWVQSLQNDDGGYHDKRTPASGILQTYRTLSILKELNSPPSNPSGILDFLKDHQQHDGFFTFEELGTAENPESRISQTYFAVAILHLLDLDPVQAGNTLDLHTLATSLQAYISRSLASPLPTLQDEQAGYLISALYELSYVNRGLVPTEARAWMLDKLQEVDTLSYAVQNVALVNNLIEALTALGVDLDGRLNAVDTYLQQTVLPQQNATGGFGFGAEAMAAAFMEPMVTYEVVKLCSTSSAVHYPHADTLRATLNVHRVTDGWIQFISFDPSAEATYYALALAKQNGDINNYSTPRLAAYLAAAIEEVGMFAANIEQDGVRHVDPNEVRTQLRTLLYAVKAYDLLKGHLPARLRGHVITAAATLIHDFPFGSTNEDSLWNEAVALSSFVSLFNEMGIWPSDNFGLLDKMEAAASQLAQSIKNNKRLPVTVLRDFFVLNIVLRFCGLPEADQNLTIVVNALDTLSVKNGFRRSLQLAAPDVDSTYMGLQVLGATGRVTVDVEKTMQFTLSSQDYYGFNYTPEKSDSASDLKVTYEGLWILNFLTTGKDLNVFTIGKD